MKRWGVAVLAVVLSAPVAARAVSLGVGVFAGPSIPVVQDDNGNGTQFGVRVPIHLVPLLTIEPFYARTGLGDVSETFGGLEYERSGFDIDSFGATAALGGVGLAAGMPFYPYASIASHKLSRDGSEDITEVGYEAGLGFGLRFAPVSINLRGGFGLIVIEDTSRKFVNVNLGVSTKLLGLP